MKQIKNVHHDMNEEIKKLYNSLSTNKYWFINEVCNTEVSSDTQQITINKERHFRNVLNKELIIRIVLKDKYVDKCKNINCPIEMTKICDIYTFVHYYMSYLKPNAIDCVVCTYDGREIIFSKNLHDTLNAELFDELEMDKMFEYINYINKSNGGIQYSV